MKRTLEIDDSTVFIRLPSNGGAIDQNQVVDALVSDVRVSKTEAELKINELIREGKIDSGDGSDGKEFLRLPGFKCRLPYTGDLSPVVIEGAARVIVLKGQNKVLLLNEDGTVAGITTLRTGEWTIGDQSVLDPRDNRRTIPRSEVDWSAWMDDPNCFGRIVRRQPNESGAISAGPAQDH